MATLTVQNIDTDGVAPTFASCAVGGDKVAPAEGRYIEVKNTSGGALDVVLATPATVDSLAVDNRTVSVPATTGVRKIAVPADLYRDPADGLAAITYPGGVTGLTIGFFAA